MFYRARQFAKSFLSRQVTELLDLYKLRKQVDQHNDSSFAGEYDSLRDVLKKLNIQHDGFVVDIAAGDGFNQSCTLDFFKRGWAGLAVEMDPKKFSKLSYIYSDFTNAKLARSRVTPYTIESLLKSFEVPKNFEILNLDIDSFDLYVVKSLLQCGYAPQIITMEINEKIPSGIFFTVNYDENFSWQRDHFYGCSIDAAAEVIKPFDYILAALIYNNAFFIKKEIAKNIYNDLSPEEAYTSGYKNKPDRKTLYPWNLDVEEWLHRPLEDVVKLINDYYTKHHGKYTLRLS